MEEFKSVKNYVKFAIKVLILLQVINFFVCGSVAVTKGEWHWDVFGEVALYMSLAWIFAIVFGPFISHWLQK